MTFAAFREMVTRLKRENLNVTGFFLLRPDYEELYSDTGRVFERDHPATPSEPKTPVRFQLMGYRIEPTNQ